MNIDKLNLLTLDEEEPISIHLKGHKIVGDLVRYIFDVIRPDGRHTVERRFSEIMGLHERLGDIVGKITPPPKHLFTADTSNEDFIRKRELEIQQYFRRLMDETDVRSFPIFRQFFEIPIQNPMIL